MPKLSAVYIFINKLKWFIYDIITSSLDALLWLINIPVHTDIKSSKEDVRIIMYVGEFLPPRIARLAKWCKRYENFTTLLLCHKRGFVEKFSSDEVDHVILFRNKWHLKRLVRNLPAPYVLHGF